MAYSFSPPPLVEWAFQRAVLAEIPPLILLLTLPALCLQLARAGTRRGATSGSLPMDRGAKMQCLLTGFMLIDKLFLLVLACYDQWWEGEQVLYTDYLGPATQSAALLVLLWAEERSRVVGLVPPGVVFCSWLLFWVTSLSELYWMSG